MQSISIKNLPPDDGNDSDAVPYDRKYELKLHLTTYS